MRFLAKIKSVLFHRKPHLHSFEGKRKKSFVSLFPISLYLYSEINFISSLLLFVWFFFTSMYWQTLWRFIMCWTLKSKIHQLLKNVSSGIYTCCTNAYHSHSSLSAQKIVMVISGKCYPIILNGPPVSWDSKSPLEILEDNHWQLPQSCPFRSVWLLLMIYFLRQAQAAMPAFSSWRSSGG